MQRHVQEADVIFSFSNVSSRCTVLCTHRGSQEGGRGGGGDRVGRGKRTRGKKFDKTLINMDQKSGTGRGA